MTSASMTFGRPTRLTVPRGSLWFANIAAAVLTLLRRLDAWQLKSVRTEPQTAEEVLDWARQIEATDPSMAADLRAAALRSLGQSDR